MREHFTTITSWQMIRKLDMVGIKMTKALSTQIDGCPYEINLEVALTEKELYNMGYDVANVPEENIAYGLEAHRCEKEMAVHSLMWEHINRVKMVMSQYDTNSWRLESWDAHCPFLFECDPQLPDEEAMQEERETWV